MGKEDACRAANESGLTAFQWGHLLAMGHRGQQMGPAGAPPRCPSLNLLGNRA